jgi:cysteine-rich repeat protein
MKKINLLKYLLVLLMVFSVSQVWAAELQMFATSGEYSGALGGQEGADAICMTEAANIGQSGTFIAYLSYADQHIWNRINMEEMYNTPYGEIGVDPVIVPLQTFTGNYWFGSTSANHCIEFTSEDGVDNGRMYRRGTPEQAPCDEQYNLLCIETTLCGNNLVDTNEHCDDGNLVNGDGCSADCFIECVEDEMCGSQFCVGLGSCVEGVCVFEDKPILEDGDACTKDDCDEVNDIVTHTQITTCEAGDGCCPSSCNYNNDGDCGALCGNNVIELDEECDDGNNILDDCHDCKIQKITTNLFADPWNNKTISGRPTNYRINENLASNAYVAILSKKVNSYSWIALNYQYYKPQVTVVYEDSGIERGYVVGDKIQISLMDSDGTPLAVNTYNYIGNFENYLHAQWTETIDVPPVYPAHTYFYQSSENYPHVQFVVGERGEYTLAYTYITPLGATYVEEHTFIVDNQPPKLDKFQLTDLAGQPMSTLQDQGDVYFDVRATDWEEQLQSYLLDTGKSDVEPVGRIANEFIWSACKIGDTYCRLDSPDLIAETTNSGDPCSCKSYHEYYEESLPAAYYIYENRFKTISSDEDWTQYKLPYVYADCLVGDKSVCELKLYAVDDEFAVSDVAEQTLTLTTTTGRYAPIIKFTYDDQIYSQLDPDADSLEIDVRIKSSGNSEMLSFDAAETLYYECVEDNCKEAIDGGFTPKLDYAWYVNVKTADSAWGRIDDNGVNCVRSADKYCAYAESTTRTEDDSNRAGTPCTCELLSDWSFPKEIYQGATHAGRLFEFERFSEVGACSKDGELNPCNVILKVTDPITSKVSQMSFRLNILGAGNNAPGFKHILPTPAIGSTDTPYTFDVFGINSDAGDVITIDLLEGHDLENVTFDGQTFNWTTPEIGTYEVTFQVSDGDGGHTVDNVVSFTIGLTVDADFTLISSNGDPVDSTGSIIVGDPYTLKARITSDEDVDEYLWQIGNLGEPWGRIDLTPKDARGVQEWVCRGEDITCGELESWQYYNKLAGEPCTCIDAPRLSKEMQIYPESYFEGSSSPVYTWSSPGECPYVKATDARVCEVSLTILTENSKATVSKTYPLTYTSNQFDLNNDQSIDLVDLEIFRQVLLGNTPDGLYLSEQDMEMDGDGTLTINDYIKYREVIPDE